MKIFRLNFFNTKWIIYFLGLALLFSCQEKEQKPDQKDTNTKYTDSLYQLQVDLNQVSLNEEATEIALTWEDYMATQTELEQWQDYQFTEILSNTDNLQSVTDSLRISVPKKFNNKPIQSRLKTLSTQANMLNLYVDKSDDHQAMYQQAQTIITTFIGLKRQMNEVFIEEFKIEE
jgi:hypothetical protein